MRRVASALAAALVAACGLVDGLQGTKGVPNGAPPPLSALQWHGPVQIDQGAAAQADAPSLAWGQGAAWVSFYAFDLATNTASTWVTRRPRGGAFAAPVQIPNAPGWDGGSAYGQIAVGAAGDAVLAADAWVLNSSHVVADVSVWATRVSTALGTGAPVRLDATSEDSLSQGASLAVGEGGEAWVTFGSALGPVSLVSQLLGGAWSQPDQLADHVVNSQTQVAAGAGLGLAIYSTPASGGSADSIWYAVAATASSGGPVLRTPKQLAVGSYVFVDVAARGAQGMAVAAPGDQALHSFTYSNGAWGFEQIVSDPAAAPYVEPALATNSKGEAVLIWRAGVPGNTDSYSGVEKASFWDGGSWSPPQQISNAGINPHAWWGKVDLNDRGEAVAAWTDFEPTGTYARIYASVLETSSGAPVWSAPVAVDADSPDAGLADQPQNERYVSVGLERDGGVAQIIWMQHEAGSAAAPRTWANWLEAN